MEYFAVALTLFLKLFTVYFACMALFNLKRRKTYPAAPPQTRFAVIVAARNEEEVIGNIVRSIQAQNYPAALRDIFVAPNNCTDNTEAVAAAAGAEIIRCLAGVESKGAALHQAIAQLRGRGYDAYVVFDADNVAHPDFLARMNDAFAAGAKVCKSRMMTANARESGVAGCYGLYFTSFDYIFNRPRSACGLSAKLVGTGFAVHREVIEEMGGWNTGTIAEDAEFSAQCARLGHRVHWVSEALTYDEAPNSFLLSLRQRKRWCSGVMQVAKQELGVLWRGSSPRPMLRWDMTMFLLMPFAQAISGLLLFLNMALIGETYAAAFLCLLPLSYAGMALIGAALSLIGGYGLRGMLPAIAAFPIFMASWLPLHVVSLFKDTKKWHAVAHTGRQAAAIRL